MKLYKFLLKIPFKELKSIEATTNMSISYRYIGGEDDLCLALYAWTTEKKKRDEFRENRSSDFIYDVVENFPDEYLDKFKIEYKNSYLDYIHLEHYDKDEEKLKKVQVLCTLDEYECITEYTEELFAMIVEKFTKSEPYYLQDKYYRSLDSILYTMYHDIFWAISEEEEDYVSYNKSFGLTPGGSEINGFIDNIDVFNLFINLYGRFFK